MHKSIDDMRKLMDEQGTPYLDVTDIQYIRVLVLFKFVLNSFIV